MKFIQSQTFKHSLLAGAILAATPLLASAGAVYTMNNSADGNAIIAFDRTPNGKLRPLGEFATGGLGSSDGLGNQGGVILDTANRFLFAVNAGSSDISVFQIEADGLSLVDVEPAGGLRPISLTYSGNILYVLNNGAAAGDVDSIVGFRVADTGELSPIAGAVQPLSGDNVGPAQIGFNDDGDVLVVSEKATNLLVTYTVNDQGIASAPSLFPSAGITPFGFSFGERDQLLVSEAAGGAAGESTLSSYALDEEGGLTLISGAVPSFQSAACWAVVSTDGRFVYTANTASDTLSGYRVDFSGAVELLQDDGVAVAAGDGPLDMVVSSDGRNLYTLNGAGNSISSFRINPRGDLIERGPELAVPETANGLAIW